MQILRIVIVEKKDALAVLPTGFGKISLIFQLMAPFADFMDFGFRSTETNSIVLVVSPLNALIRDQVTKLRECGLKACILKRDRVALDGGDEDGEQVCISEPLEKLLKTTEFQRRVNSRASAI